MGIRCTDGVVLEVFSCSKRTGFPELVARETTETRDAHGDAPAIISLTSGEVLACFTGHALERAQRIAQLTPAQFRKIFGIPHVPGTHYETGRKFRRIGKAIRPVELGGSPAVNAALRTVPACYLQAAVKLVDPDHQIRAVVKAQLRGAIQRGGRARGASGART